MSAEGKVVVCQERNLEFALKKVVVDVEGAPFVVQVVLGENGEMAGREGGQRGDGQRSCGQTSWWTGRREEEEGEGREEKDKSEGD